MSLLRRTPSSTTRNKLLRQLLQALDTNDETREIVSATLEAMLANDDQSLSEEDRQRLIDTPADFFAPEPPPRPAALEHAKQQERNLDSLQRRFLTEDIQQKIEIMLDESPLPEDRAKHREHIGTLFDTVIMEEKLLLSPREQQWLRSRVISHFTGLDVLEPLLEDYRITDIVVRGTSPIIVTRNNKREVIDVAFKDKELLDLIILRLLDMLPATIDKTAPLIHARMPRGDYITVFRPPASLPYSVLHIRTMVWALPSDITGLIERDILTQAALEFIQSRVKAGENLLIAGRQRTGKTALLNSLFNSDLFANLQDEFNIIIEEKPELHSDGKHTIHLFTLPRDIYQPPEVTVPQLLDHAFHMPADFLVIGELTGGEVLALLQTPTRWLSTLHADSPEDIVPRLMTACHQAPTHFTDKAIRRLIASSNTLILYMENIDHSKRVTMIGRIDETMRLVPLWQPDETGVLQPVTESNAT